MNQRQALIAFARRQLGQPYVWGGESRREGGFDCSGLVWAAYRAAGYKGIGRTSEQQIRQGRAVSLRSLQPGDLVFPNAGHVGIYIGNGRVLSSPHTGATVHISSLADFGGVTARRLIRGGGGLAPPRGPVVKGGVGLPVPQAQAIQLSMPKLNFTPPATAAVSALPGGTMQPGSPAAQRQSVLPGLPEVSQSPSPAGSLEAIRRRLIA